MAPLAPGSVGGVAVTWLHECDHSASAIVAREAAGLVWQTIEAAGRPYGISCVGHEAANRYRLMERAMSTGAVSSEPAALRRLLADLQQLEREIVELEYVRRSDALDRVREAVRRLGEVGSPEGILDRAAEGWAQAPSSSRILISELDNQSLRAADDLGPRGPRRRRSALAELRTHSIRLEYPLVEDEVARGQHIEIVTVARAGSRAPAALTDALAWDAYVVALTGRSDGRAPPRRRELHPAGPG